MRSGRILAEMVNPKNTSRTRNDAPDPEPTVILTVDTTWTSNPIELIGQS